MKDLISNKHKHLLYKDEINNIFLLTKHFEIFKCSDKILGMYIFNRLVLKKLRDEGLLIGEKGSDEKFHIAYIELKNLDKIIDMFKTTRRLNENCKRMEYIRSIIGHEIKRFNPAFKSDAECDNYRVKQGKSLI